MHVVNKSELPLIGSSYNFVGLEQNVPISMFLVEAHPGRGAALHLHEYDEIILVQEGRSRIVVDSDIREVSTGDIVVVKAFTPHGFINVGDGTLKQIDIHLSTTFKQKNLEPTEVSRKAGLPMHDGTPLERTRA